MGYCHHGYFPVSHWRSWLWILETFCLLTLSPSIVIFLPSSAQNPSSSDQPFILSASFPLFYWCRLNIIKYACTSLLINGEPSLNPTYALKLLYCHSYKKSLWSFSGENLKSFIWIIANIFHTSHRPRSSRELHVWQAFLRGRLSKEIFRMWFSVSSLILSSNKRCAACR